MMRLSSTLPLYSDLGFNDSIIINVTIANCAVSYRCNSLGNSSLVQGLILWHH